MVLGAHLPDFCIWSFAGPSKKATATVDAEGNNLFMGDGQKATNEGGRGLRTHNVVVDWLSHWFHVAGIKHKGGFRGRPDTCKGLFGRECLRL